MKGLTYSDIAEMVRNDESRELEVKKTTGELISGMCSGCAFLNSDGGWVLFGVTPALKIVGQDVSDSTRQEIAREMRKFAPAIDLVAQYIDVPDTSGKKVSLQRFYTKNSRHLLRMS
ncbi:MAG: ATP-binding protein [Bacteroidales bacterium]|nr:ATP-binding protein [Bacteroidales bacterium]